MVFCATGNQTDQQAKQYDPAPSVTAMIVRALMPNTCTAVGTHHWQLLLVHVVGFLSAQPVVLRLGLLYGTPRQRHDGVGGQRRDNLPAPDTATVTAVSNRAHTIKSSFRSAAAVSSADANVTSKCSEHPQ